MFRSKLRLFMSLLVTVLSLLAVAGASGVFAAEKTWPVYINGAKSSLKAKVMPDGTVLAPLSFPIGKDKQEYDVSIHKDATAHIVYIERKPKTPKLRGEGEKCYYCSGTGKCQYCYPAGSGVNTSGISCGYCSATGKCWYCEGTGDKTW